MSPLMQELLSSRRRALQPAVAAGLGAAGIAAELLCGVDFIAVRGDIYTPEIDGAAAVIVPSFAPTGNRRILDDLVAIDFESRFSTTRSGTARALGVEWLSAALAQNHRVPVYLDGLRWLASGCRGVFVVDLEISRYLFEGVVGISCSNEPTARRLYDAMTRPLRMPPIFMSEVRDAA